jgi:hypothetical protein
VTSIEHPATAELNPKAKGHVGNAIYFTCGCEPTLLIVQYDVVSQELSIMDGSPASRQ